jgi:hypothetical protein
MTSSSEFDWQCSAEEKEYIAVRQQRAIGIYLNPHDEVVIRQEGHYGPEEDHWIYITKDNVPKVQALLETAGFETATTSGEPLLLQKPEPLTAAERQKRNRDKHRNGNGDVRVTEGDEVPLRTVGGKADMARTLDNVRY